MNSLDFVSSIFISNQKKHSAHSGETEAHKDHIFTLRQISEKIIEFGKEAHLCFIDIQKAFDIVPWNKVSLALRRKDVTRELTARIESLYKNSWNYVRTGNCKSNIFQTSAGLKEGDTLSPLIFIMIMNEMAKRCREKTKKFAVGYWKLQPVTLSELTYADDIVLITEDQRNLQYNLNIWKKVLKEYNLKINVQKTKSMVLGMNEKKHKLKFSNQTTEQVQRFRYLGAILTHNEKSDEINGRISSTNKAYHALSQALGS